ncbi:MAG: dihydropyrimidinase [Planctomycetota bacterium]|nr:dihydropyrimidinase [Planctomycetota bacterium]
MKMKILNGIVVTSAESFKADIGIENGLITKIERKSKTAVADLLPEFSADEVINADGKYVLPGGVDVHTHFDMLFGGAVTADDFYTGTVSAVCGGTTTIIDFAIQNKGEGIKDALDKWHKKATNRAVIDYSFHIAITDVTDKIISEIPQIINEGITSFKLFMAYKDTLMSSEENISRILSESGRLGFLTMLHCEQGEEIDRLTKELLADGKTTSFYHALSRPADSEESAVLKSIEMTRKSKGNLYIVHLSSEGGLNQIKKSFVQNQSVFAETCPQYLVLSMDKYLATPSASFIKGRKGEIRLPTEFEGAKYVMSPPLRGRHNLSALWKGIKENFVRVVSTDHCAFNFYTQKTLGLKDFSKIPNGIPGVETRLYLLFNEGVIKKRITINKLVDIFATAPAKLFGLYPKKGEIRLGADADLVIFDPSIRLHLKSIKLHQDVDYCPFEGYKGKGKVFCVLSKGKIVVREKAFCGKKGDGEFIKRNKFNPLCLQV